MTNVNFKDSLFLHFLSTAFSPKWIFYFNTWFSFFTSWLLYLRWSPIWSTSHRISVSLLLAWTKGQTWPSTLVAFSITTWRRCIQISVLLLLAINTYNYLLMLICVQAKNFATLNCINKQCVEHFQIAIEIWELLNISAKILKQSCDRKSFIIFFLKYQVRWSELNWD